MIYKKIEVFDGVNWSPAEVVPAGSALRFLRIVFSDGSHLDCAPGQMLRVKWSWQGKQLKEIRADALKVGHIVPPFRVLNDIHGSCEQDAYTYAAFLGDGGIEMRKDRGRNRYCLSLYQGKHHLPVTGTRAKKGASGEIKVTVSHLDPAKLTRMKQPGLPDWVFALNRASTSQFVAGLIDTDGCFNRNTGGIAFDTSDHETARDVQLLLRRFGCAYVSMHQTAKAGDVTNFGPRLKPMYRVYAPESEAALLQGYRVASDRPIVPERVVKQSRIVSIQELAGPVEMYTVMSDGPVVIGNTLTMGALRVNTHMSSMNGSSTPLCA